MRTIAVVTVGRSDFGIYLPVLNALQAEPALRTHLIVSGGHLSPAYGMTVEEIVRHGFAVGDRVETLLAGDTPEAVARSIGLGVLSFPPVYQRVRPDLLLVLGDRYDMFAAAVAAVPMRIPIAHLHGGEVTVGAFDEAFRHSMTKCSHLHFASTAEHARRLVQMGEEPWRVTVSGAPALDHLKQIPILSDGELEARVGMRLESAPLLVTFHPTTLVPDQCDFQIDELLTALADRPEPIVATKPNADPGGLRIIEKLRTFAQSRPHVAVVDSLGVQAYFSLMRRAAAMVGNSSSGIIEAASFGLPVVNIGLRQAGRPRSANVIDVGHSREEIAAGLRRAASPTFRSSLNGLVNIYGTGDAARRIVDRLKSVALDERLLLKRFHDLPPQMHREAA